MPAIWSILRKRRGVYAVAVTADDMVRGGGELHRFPTKREAEQALEQGPGPSSRCGDWEQTAADVRGAGVARAAVGCWLLASQRGATPDQPSTWSEPELVTPGVGS